MIYVSVDNLTLWESESISALRLRFDEKQIVLAEVQSVEASNIIAVFDIRATNKLIALLSIFRTLFVCIALGVGAYLFTRDAN